MPTLDWIGKKAVINHDKQVPFHLLNEVPELSYGDKDSGNMLIQGDNLIALKSLLPYYAGKVKCIYIDPPYNTGNEGWIYNDNVNSPEIKEWLGNVVGKEAEDLSRHDKWLCMMYPRLKLLRNFLRQDGSIWISIDDNEVAHLRLLCDEIFGANNFVADIAWQRTYSMRNDAKGVPAEIEHLLVYSKRPDWQPQKLERTESMDSKYKNPDNDPKGAWRNIVASAPDSVAHQGMVYAIQNPMTGKLVYPPKGRHWSLGQPQMLDAMNAWCNYELKNLHDDKQRASVCNISIDDVRKDVLAIVVKDTLEEAREKAQNIYKNGYLPEFFFSKNGQGTLSRKAYLKAMGGRPVTNLWSFDETGHTDEASRLLKNIFGGTTVFDTPKPPRLIQRILQVATQPGDLILDSFAGSGTTGHAVLKQNAEDNGGRRFILVEMVQNIAEDITAERIRRVSNGFIDTKGKQTPALGGGFRYYRLGNPLFDEFGNVFSEIKFADLAKHVFFSETGMPLPDSNDLTTPFIGEYNERGIFLLYNGILKDKNPKNGNVLTREVLAMLPKFDGEKVIYGTGCRLSDARLKAERITFKQIPYDLRG